MGILRRIRIKSVSLMGFEVSVKNPICHLVPLLGFSKSLKIGMTLKFLQQRTRVCHRASLLLSIAGLHHLSSSCHLHVCKQDLWKFSETPDFSSVGIGRVLVSGSEAIKRSDCHRCQRVDGIAIFSFNQRRSAVSGGNNHDLRAFSDTRPRHRSRDKSWTQLLKRNKCLLACQHE